MKKFLLNCRFLVPVVVAAFVMLPAQADVITLTLAQLDAFTCCTNVTGAPGTGTTTDLGNGSVQFSTDFSGAPNGTREATYNSVGLPMIAFVAGDKFILNIFNSNGLPWKWTVELFEGATARGDGSAMPAGSASGQIIIPWDSGAKFDTVAISISDNGIGADGSGDADFSPVPEPSSAALLLFGAGGLAFVGQIRRKMGL